MAFTNLGLDHEQEALLKQAGAWLAGQDFYLAGGTALAIYYGHRRSVDLDWFTLNAIPDALVLAQRLRLAGLAFETGHTAPGTLYGQVGSVRLSFIEFRYPLLNPCVTWEANGAALASLDDLACMKLSAVAQRGSRKDFYDIHTLISRHRPLADLLQLYQQKFRVGDISPVLYGLAYFDDAEQEPEPSMLIKLPWKQVQKDLAGWLREMAR